MMSVVGIKGTIRVLLIEDDEIDQKLVRRLLSKEDSFGCTYIVDVVGTLGEALKMLQGGQYHLVLLDLNLPDSSSLSALEKIQVVAQLPVIILTTGLDQKTTLEALQRGAQDFLVKGSFDHDMLQRSIRYSLARDHIKKNLFLTREKTQKIIKGAQEAFVSIDEKGTVIEWNFEAEKVFGWTEKEAVGSLLCDLVVPQEHRDNLRNELKIFLETGKSKILGKRLETPALHKNGKAFPIELTVTELKLEGQHNFYAFIRDITDRKIFEADLLKAKEEALEASSIKSAFLANMSHEIRTPLNCILGMADFLLEGTLGDQQREYVSAISLSGKSLLLLINNILDASKIEAGKFELEPVECDLDSYLNDFCKPFGFTARKKGIEFQYESVGLSHSILIDTGCFGQIVANLVSNAIKFTSQGKVKVQINCETQKDSTSQLILTIQDTGIGIPASAKARMFQAFSQADSSIAGRFGGTGLGLSISKNLIEKMKGTISFTSEEEKGTTFVVKIPVQQGATLASPEFKAKTALAQAWRPSTLSGRVLVAEDNQTNQLIIARILGQFGLQVLLAANGNEVLDTLRNHQCDIILMDCRMPHLDGFETTRIIRKTPTLPQNIPIIALTAYVNPGVEEQCLQAGMNSYLTKPIDKTTLDALLQKYLTKTNEWIDRTVLKQFDDLYVEGLPDILIETIDSFLNTTPHRIQVMNDSITKNDIAAASDEAHALKSSSRILGATLLSQVCQKLENFQKDKEVTSAAHLFASLKSIYDRSSKELLSIREARIREGFKGKS